MPTFISDCFVAFCWHFYKLAKLFIHYFILNFRSFCLPFTIKSQTWKKHMATQLVQLHTYKMDISSCHWYEHLCENSLHLPAWCTLQQCWGGWDSYQVLCQRKMCHKDTSLRHLESRNLKMLSSNVIFKK